MQGPHELFARASDPAFIDRLVENSNVEKKSGRIGKAALAEYFSMWANTSPDGGLILVGVENDGSKAGLLALSDRQVAGIELAAHDLCSEATYDRNKIEIINHKGQPDYVFLFYVHYNRNRVVETAKGDAFIRRGDQKHTLSELEKAELRIDKGEVDFEDEPCGIAYPGDFNLKVVQEFCDEVRKTLRTNDPRTNEEVLILRRLGRHSPEQIPTEQRLRIALR